jgi:hypothetical protein
MLGSMELRRLSHVGDDPYDLDNAGGLAFEEDADHGRFGLIQ